MNSIRKNILPAIAILLAAITTVTAAPAAAGDEIRVVTTIPDLAFLAKAVGGDLITVKSVTRGNEDMHRVPMKPSLLLLLNRADLLVEMGLDNEHAWLPELLRTCRNDAIQPEAPGFVNCSSGIERMDVYERTGRDQGMIHPEGNPHYNLDPGNAGIIAGNICEGLCRIRPNDAKTFRKNLTLFEKRLAKRLARWEEMAKPLRGLKVVTYHRSWCYFARRFGIEVVGHIEPKPGIAPSAGHLARLIRTMKDEKVRLVIKETYFSDRYPRLLEEKTGVPFVSLPNMSGGSEATADYFKLFDHNLTALLEAVGRPVAAGDSKRNAR